MGIEQNQNRWVSRRQTAIILGLNPTRVMRFLTNEPVRQRVVPLGKNRRTNQFWLPDVVSLQHGELNP